MEKKTGVHTVEKQHTKEQQKKKPLHIHFRQTVEKQHTKEQQKRKQLQTHSHQTQTKAGEADRESVVCVSSPLVSLSLFLRQSIS